MRFHTSIRCVQDALIVTGVLFAYCIALAQSGDVVFEEEPFDANRVNMAKYGCSLSTAITTNEGGFVVHDYDAGVCLHAYVKEPREVLVIPEWIDGKQVRRIANHAFKGSPFRKISIPDSVTDIGSGAFSFCAKLDSIKIPEGVKKINKNMLMSCSSLTHVVLSSKTQKIGEMAFAGCTALKKIELPESVECIEDGAFVTTQIETLITPQALTTIGTGAFVECVQLTNVVFMGENITIGANAFCDCTHLTSATFAGSVQKTSVFAFSGCPNLHAVRFKKAPVGTVDSMAFSGSPLVCFYHMDGQGEAKIKPCGIYSAEDVVPDLEKYSSSRHGLVQLVRVKLTGDRAGNSTVTCTFTNTTGQTIVFYPELYTRTLAFYDCKDEHRCPIHPRVFVYMQMKPVRALSRTHPTRLQKWGSDQYTDVYEKAPEALSFYENLENVQTMTLEVCFRRHQIKDISIFSLESTPMTSMVK